MAVALECINFIVSFSVIRKKYPGGLVQCLLDHRGVIASHYTQLPIPHGLHDGDRDSDIT